MRERGNIETGIGTRRRPVRENRVRDLTTKEPRRRWEE